MQHYTMQSYELYKQRRANLVNRIKLRHSIVNGCIVLLSGFEEDRKVFRQESSFYYLTGIKESGVACVINLDGTSTLYVPRYTIDRSVWSDISIQLTQDNAELLGFDNVKFLGEPYQGYALAPYSPLQVYATLQADIVQAHASNNCTIFSLIPDNAYEYVMQRMMCERLFDTSIKIEDISADIASMRRIKSEEEIASLRHAIHITARAQYAAARAIKSGVNEAAVRAALEYEMAKNATHTSFPSIVASGSNATILHYNACNQMIKDGDLVVVDIGAEYDYYAADITRTYPASGTFSARQRAVYQLVLDAQEYVAQFARPGYWLRNAKNPKKSLHHLAVGFFEKHGYAEFFPHGIGHYLGLEVHDVGSYQEPLEIGDVITIEPGLYLRQESIGIRIEDNYVITSTGAECLSAEIPKTVDAIEALMMRYSPN